MDHTTFQRSEICGLRPKTTQRIWQQFQYSRVQKLTSNFKFRRGNHPSLTDNVLYINFNVICVIQITSAILLVISISGIEEHRATAIGAHVKGCHEISNPELLKQLSVLKKCLGKLDCEIFIHEGKPKLNTHSDSAREKVL